MRDDVAFGARLRAFRQSAGLSQQELAELAELSVRAISDLERGRTRWPYRSSLLRLAGALMLNDVARAEFIASAGRRLGPVAIAGREARSAPADPETIGPCVSACPGSVLAGRSGELAELPGLLAQDRLITLVGPPGSGKTRLALEVAARRTAMSWDAVHLVRLDLLSDPRNVPAAVLAVIGTSEDPHLLVEENVIRALAGRRDLLVLDNCEHLRESCGRLVADLLDRCRQMRVLATSREPLGLIGERIYYVPPPACAGPWTVSRWR